MDGVVGRLGVAVALVERGFQQRRDLAVFDHQLTAIPGVDRLQVIVDEDEIGAAAAAEAADLVAHAEAGGAVERAHRPGLFGFDAAADGFADDPIEAEAEEIVGVAIVGADAVALVAGTEFGDRLDGFDDGIPRRCRIAAAEEDPDAGIDEIVGNVAIDGFVRVGDAGRGIGGDEFAAIDVAGDRATALEGLGDDGVAARIAHGDGDEVHLFAEGDGFGPLVEEGADFFWSQVAAGGFEFRRGGGDGRRDSQEDRERGEACVFEHGFDAGHVHDVADLVAVAEDRRGAIEQSRLGIGAGGDHRTFDMDMGIDEAGGDDAASGIVDGLGGRGGFVGAGRFDRGDAAAGEPDFLIGRDAFGIGRQHAGAGDDEIGRRPAPGNGGEGGDLAMKRGYREAGNRHGSGLGESVEDADPGANALMEAR